MGIIKTFVGDYELIDNKTVQVSAETQLKIQLDNIYIHFEFEETDGNETPATKFEVNNEVLTVKCINFSRSTTAGLMTPVEIGTFDNKPIFLTFFVNSLTGKKKKNVSYSLYQKKING